ncbi:fungal specific transcription factor domain-containing protein [Rhizoctonia solani AG-1 IA]|uniref:Fungal specific transcription factor domain-containing protein n=1 Tax=Thanatephorus cucumeris (strain AG1-IA) TaxID=983506 RepID=L8WJ45_THACA|nr:fungal specific transcription factor domain-containing protein [Rhizoctonia solani AG-1 IA]
MRAKYSVNTGGCMVVLRWLPKNHLASVLLLEQLADEPPSLSENSAGTPGRQRFAADAPIPQLRMHGTSPGDKSCLGQVVLWSSIMSLHQQNRPKFGEMTLPYLAPSEAVNSPIFSPALRSCSMELALGATRIASGSGSHQPFLLAPAMHSTPGRKPNGRLKIKVEQATCDQCRLNKVCRCSPPAIPVDVKRSAYGCCSFVSYLENRVGELERKLKHVRMFIFGINLNRELETLAQLPALPPPQPTFTHLSPSTSTPQSSPSPAATPFQHIPAQNEPPVLNSAPALLKQVRQVTLSSPLAQAPRLKNDMYWSATASTKEEEPRFHGTSSGEILLRDAKEIRREYVPWAGSGKILRRRHEFWEAPLPERRCRDAELDPVELPPADLIRSLVNLFFRHMNTFYPIFHRGWFEHRLLSGAHLASDTTGRTFARLLLLVCAVASRWSSDPRVFIQGQTLSAGYEFFRRAGPVTWAVRAHHWWWSIGRPKRVPSSQLCSFMAPRHTTPDGSFWELGSALRRMSEPTEGRKGTQSRMNSTSALFGLLPRSPPKLFTPPSPRSRPLNFPESTTCMPDWALICLDRSVCSTLDLFWIDRCVVDVLCPSAALGRPSAMQDTDSDLEPLIEIDDEDWPIEGARSQDLEKPSRLSYFNGLIGITRILGRAIQTLVRLIYKRQLAAVISRVQYALDRTKRQMGLVGSQKEGELLVDLQRHLEQWKQTIPSHLRIETASGIFVEQAIALWSTYHHVNIIIHREFITKESVLTANCLNRCRRSAHECARLLDLQLRSEECHIIPVTVQAAFSSAMVLTFDLLSGEKASRNDRGDPWPSTEDWYPKVEKEANLKTCMLILELAETKYYIAGRWHDTLKEFLHSGVKLDSFRPEHKVQGSSPSIDQPPANRRDSGSMPGPGEPYPFNFTYDPPRGPSYGPEQVSGMVAGTATSSPSLSVAAYNTFVLPYTTPSNVPAAVYPHSAYLPDAYYGGDTAIPFPGYVSQLNFDPNQGREEEYEWERQASYVVL